MLDGPHPPEVKEQALIIISNITAGARDKDYVMEDENIIKKIREFLVRICRLPVILLNDSYLISVLHSSRWCPTTSSRWVPCLW